LLAWKLFLIIACLKKLTRSGAVILIIAATLLVYWPALRNGFVWDDTALVLRDPLIRSWRLIPEGFRHFLFLDATASEFYRPIQRLSFGFDYQVYGLGAPWGWHLTSILVHAGAVVALFFMVEGVIAALAPKVRDAAVRGLALGVALLWVIHPMHTSAVTYVAGRADPLAALFGFTALALGVRGQLRKERHVRIGEGEGTAVGAPGSSRGPWLWDFGAAMGFFLAMLSKESGLIFLPIWLVFLAWRKETRRALIPWGVIAVALFAGYTGLRRSSEHVAPPPAPATSLAVRPILAARAFAEYAGLLIAPVTLRMERDVSTRPMDTPEETLRMARLREYETLAGVLLVIGFGWWARYCFRYVPVGAFGLTAFVIAYLPISNLLSLNATIAEHWLYVPSAFLWLAVWVTGFAVVQRAFLGLVQCREPEGGDCSSSVSVEVIALAPSVVVVLAVPVIVAAGWVVFLGGRTFYRQADWRDQRTFVERTMAAGGNSPRMMMNLANVEFGEGHMETAIKLYREALRRAPDQAIIWFGYGSVLMRAHDFAGAREALTHADKSAFLAPDICLVRAGLENAETQRDPGDLLRRAVALAPKNWGIRQQYIQYLHDSGQRREALRELQGFLQGSDFRAESWRLLAGYLAEEQQPKLAMEAYEEAAKRDVRDAESRAKIGEAR
jgi:tetratricopeptide (TPR) repeat protein